MKLTHVQTGFRNTIIGSIAVGGTEGSWKIFLTYHAKLLLVQYSNCSHVWAEQIISQISGYWSVQLIPSNKRSCSRFPGYSFLSNAKEVQILHFCWWTGHVWSLPKLVRHCANWCGLETCGNSLFFFRSPIYMQHYKPQLQYVFLKVFQDNKLCS